MIRLVQEQIPTASREAAVAALERNKGNVVDAIMDLDSVIR
jgi:NACalpha-BTF3-like transcription factor